MKMGAASTSKLSNGGGLVVVNADGSVSIAPASGTGLTLGVAPPATASKGLLSLGDGSYDGSSAGHFVGNANGTHLAVNAASGFTGNLLDLQRAGVSAFGVSANLAAGNAVALNAQAGGFQFNCGGSLYAQFGANKNTILRNLIVTAGSSGVAASGGILDIANASSVVVAGARADGLLYGTTSGLATKVKAGVPADADWAVAPPDGTIVGDSTDSKLYIRLGGTWKAVTVA